MRNSKKKHYYEVKVGDAKSKYFDSYKYDYGSTRDVRIVVGKTGFSLSSYMSAKYEMDEITSKQLFKFGLPRALTAYILYNGNNNDKQINELISHEVLVTRQLAGGDRQEQEQVLDMLSMLGDDNFELNQKFCDRHIIESVIKINISDNNTILTVLNDLIIGKSRHSKIEKLIYLWSAFNAYYNSLTAIDGTKLTRDRDKIQEAIKLLSIDESNYFPSMKEREKMIDSIISYLNNNRITDVKNNTQATIDLQSIIDEVVDAKKHKISSIDFITYGLGYYYRCHYIHGNKTVPLVCSDENILSMVVELLEAKVEEALLSLL